MFSTTDLARDTRPRFEFYPLDSTRLQTVEIAEFPFVIGRSASAALQINSASVSREHAEVVRTPTGFCVRDLKSTNGTSVNGRKVRESPLVDGDSVTIADVELTFVCSSMGRLQRTLTKPLPRNKPVAVLPGAPPELTATRSMSEALLLQTIPLQWGDLTHCPSGELLMNAARIAAPLDDWMVQGETKVPTTVASRLELLGWQLAAEQVNERSEAGGLLLRVTQRDSLDDRVFEALDEIADSLETPRPIGVILHWEWAPTEPATLRLFKRLREQGITIVYDEFSGGGGCIESMVQTPPDYLVLSNKVVQGAVDQPRRLQRLETVHAACAAQGIEVVLPDSVSNEDAAACRELGICVALRRDRPAVAGRLPAASLAYDRRPDRRQQSTTV